MDDLLAGLDRELPGRIEGFYVVGSTCLGAFRSDRSDVDFVAVIADGGLDAAGRFGIAEPGFDVNPVTRHTLAAHGIAIRGRG
ncbi:MAG: hypothetical protein ACLP4R_19390 [Solirubrobacteraceae bacterium]